MSQDREPGELTAEEIAQRIGAAGAVSAGPPPPTQPPPAPVPPVDAYQARLIAAQRAASPPADQGTELLPVNRAPVPVDRPPAPRIRLIRDTATTLVGLSAVALIVLAVWPPSPNAGVLGVTATPSSASAAATASQTGTPEPTPTPTPDPTPTPTP